MNSSNSTNANPTAAALNLLAARYNYNHWIYKNIRRFIGDNILEVGAGIGNISDFIMNKPELTLIDNDEQFVTYLKGKYHFRKAEYCKIYNADINSIENSPLQGSRFDTIICLNVLEHIKDDKKAFTNMVSLLAPQGKLLLLVPAFSFLYGEMDKTYGHVRRYDKRSLATLAASHPVMIKKSFYMNLAGVVGWFVHGKILRRKILSERQSIIFDKLVPVLSVIERMIPPPIGQSLIFIAEKQ
ncbi:MAG: class I SAM-dependent methyltransferase [Candidatus Omnitrophica bacterium]|nr:class I SAM-dependent methyltransferase [Candidatus Omnitrophota bacterium]